MAGFSDCFVEIVVIFLEFMSMLSLMSLKS